MTINFFSLVKWKQKPKKKKHIRMNFTTDNLKKSESKYKYIRRWRLFWTRKKYCCCWAFVKLKGNLCGLKGNNNNNINSGWICLSEGRRKNERARKKKNKEKTQLVGKPERIFVFAIWIFRTNNKTKILSFVRAHTNVHKKDLF